jgi:TonB family protein
VVRSCKLAGVVAGCILVLPAAAQNGVEPIDTDYDRMPANTIVPEYPEEARMRRIEGEVQVCFDISRDGFPQRVTVRNSTHRFFDKPAVEAVRRSTWRPIPPGEKVPNIKACRTFRFNLVPVPPDERD